MAVPAKAAPSIDGYGERRPAFGAWLLAQKDRDGTLGELIATAKKDPRFPKHGDPDAVRKRLQEGGADADMWAAVDDAELDWLSY